MSLARQRSSGDEIARSVKDPALLLAMKNRVSVRDRQRERHRFAVLILSPIQLSQAGLYEQLGAA